MSETTLFSRLCSPHLLLQAWEEVKAKRAAGGVDRLSVDDFAKNLSKQIDEIVSELKSGNWKPQPYLRVEIPKKTNEKRKLGLLTVKDKVVQQAIKILVEPKFEAIFVPNSYGYRKVIGSGVSFSSNLLNQLNNNKITLDLFSQKGQHLGGFLRASSMQCSFWNTQMRATEGRRNSLAASIVEGKVVNQLYLAKYFHKYHKESHKSAENLLEIFENKVDAARDFIKNYDKSATNYIEQLMAQEAQCALQYWAYVKGMLEDDEVGFEGRVQQGAVDIVNMMLNYGYALLYSRVWRALLGCGLNPYDSVIHVRQAGKPTFVYDVVELFRAQAVDRVVFSLVQKNEPLEAGNGLLSERTKKLLAQNMMERIQKRENYRGERLSLDMIIWRQCSEIADFFEKEAKYKPYKAKW